MNKPYELTPDEQNQILEAIKAANVHVIRAAVPDDDRGFAFAQRVYDHGLKLLCQLSIKYQDGTEWPKAPEGFKGMWNEPGLSLADPVKTRAYVQSLMAKLDAKGLVMAGFEVGNEMNWAGFNADFPLPGQGRVFGLQDIASDPEAQKVARGFDKYIEILWAVKEVRDSSGVNTRTPIISGGRASEK